MKNYLSYRISGIYGALSGGIIIQVNHFLNGKIAEDWLNLQTRALLSSVIILIFVSYFIATLKTFRKGITDTKIFINKFSQL